MDLKEISSYIIGKLNCDAEVYCIRSKTLSIEARNRKVNLKSEGEETGIALRVIKDGKVGFSFSSGGDIDGLISRTLEISDAFPIDEHNILPPPEPYKEIQIFDPEIGKSPLHKKISLVFEAEKAAYSYDGAVKKTENIIYRDIETEVRLENTKGIDAHYCSNHCGLTAIVVSSRSGQEEEGYYTSCKKRLKDLDSDFVGRQAAKKAVRLLGGRQISSQKLPAVLDSEPSAELLEKISEMISADAIQKGKSMFAGKKGERMGSCVLTVIDDGLSEEMIESSPFDDEGVPKRINTIFDKGIFSNSLHNVYTASKEGVRSSGNGKRVIYRYPPVICPNNMYIKPGKSDQNALVSGIKKGLLIMRLMALHTINPVSGDFSLGASGLMIEDGKTTFPVREITVSGNLIELLNSVEEVGSDLEFFEQAANCGSPSLYIGSIYISGK